MTLSNYIPSKKMHPLNHQLLVWQQIWMKNEEVNLQGSHLVLKEPFMVAKLPVIGSLPHSLITKHGEQFVRRALGYITASKTGLTKSELEDILSCDDIVLADEVFKYHVPPIRRLPTLLWTRLRNDLGENLFHKLQLKTALSRNLHFQGNFAVLCSNLKCCLNSNNKISRDFSRDEQTMISL